ncbi:MAG: response regulator transcription factor [Phycisphaerae bacterium]
MRVLVVEDFKTLRESIGQALREQMYAVDEASDGRLALWHLQSGHVDVVILDLMMPGVDGFQVLKAMEKMKARPAVLILTARDTVDDRVKGLDAGGDDYLTKPFALEEMLARVRALTRRRYQIASSRLNIGTLDIDLNARRVFRGKKEIELSAREYAILEYLAMRQGEIVSRSDIWEHVHGDDSLPESNVVDVFVSLLRKKIDSESNEHLIHTRRGQGYMLGPGD